MTHASTLRADVRRGRRMPRVRVVLRTVTTASAGAGVAAAQTPRALVEHAPTAAVTTHTGVSGRQARYPALGEEHIPGVPRVAMTRGTAALPRYPRSCMPNTPAAT